MTVCLGGRVAEQLVFGAVTTGAANDLAEGRRDHPRDGPRLRDGRRRAGPARAGSTPQGASETRRRIHDEEQRELAFEAESRRPRDPRPRHRDKLDELAETPARARGARPRRPRPHPRATSRSVERRPGVDAAHRRRRSGRAARAYLVAPAGFPSALVERPARPPNRAARAPASSARAAVRPFHRRDGERTPSCRQGASWAAEGRPAAPSSCVVPGHAVLRGRLGRSRPAVPRRALRRSCRPASLSRLARGGRSG